MEKEDTLGKVRQPSLIEVKVTGLPTPTETSLLG